MIERYNVLELLGADKNKYHSCIITCFSFDFLFFEQRVLPKLRYAGIININLFVDAGMFQQQVNKLDGNNRNNKSYSITPVELSGAFHPKIIMALGKNNGFVAIGSGNLTNSGLSSNDEVWGAFHTYKTESEAAPLFKSVFQYLNPLEEYCYGINKTKWNWILKNTNWLKDILNNTDTATTLKTETETIEIIASIADTSIYKGVIDRLPKEPLEKLTIISPYFNKNGQVIEQFIHDLEPQSVQVVVDSRFGTLPYKYNNQADVQYYDWQKISSISSHECPRLHAKIIQFKYETKTFILIGSANASVEGLGTLKTNTKNAEMSILIGTEVQKDWLVEMNIELPAIGEFDMFNYVPQFEENYMSGMEKNTIQIRHAELDFTILKVYGTNFKELNRDHQLVIVRRDETTTKQAINCKIEADSFNLVLDEASIEGAYKIYIEDAQEVKQSNIAFLHFAQAIIKTNPDEKSVKFFNLINSDSISDNDLNILLEYAKFERAAPISNTSANTPLPYGGSTAELEDRNYEILDEEEFNKNDDVIDTGSTSNKKNLTMLEEFLDHMTFGSIVNEDFSDSDERTSEESGDEGVGDENLNNNSKEQLSYAAGKRLRDKLHKTLNEIYNAIEISHQTQLDANLDNTSPLEAIEILEDIKSVLIGLHLIIMKANDIFIEERIQMKIKFKDSNDLYSFEKERGYNISRLRPQFDVSMNEIRYSADINFLTDKEEVSRNYEDLELQEIDETPSVVKCHKYFESTPYLDKNGLHCDTLKGYLINTVSPLLLLLLNNKIKGTGEDAVKLNIYKKRLFYRVVIIFNSISWKDKERQGICKLFLLNLFEASMQDEMSIKEVLEELATYRLKLKEHFEENRTSRDLFIYHLEVYLNWKKEFNIDKESKMVELMDSSTHDIVYKGKYGFGELTTINENEINIETPLGFYYDELEIYKIEEITVGSRIITYQ